MVHYKLSYFNARALGEPARLIFALFDVPYEDYRVTVEEWNELKKKTPFGQLPVLEVDGVEIGQSMAITRYLARKFGIAGKTPEDEAQADGIVDQYKDFVVAFRQFTSRTFFGEGPDVIKKVRAEVVDPAVQPYLDTIKRFLEKSKSGYLVGDSLTWADLVVADNLTSLIRHGFIEKGNEKKLAEFHEKIHSIPNIKNLNVFAISASMKHKILETVAERCFAKLKSWRDHCGGSFGETAAERRCNGKRRSVLRKRRRKSKQGGNIGISDGRFSFARHFSCQHTISTENMSDAMLPRFHSPRPTMKSRRATNDFINGELVDARRLRGRCHRVSHAQAQSRVRHLSVHSELRFRRLKYRPIDIDRARRRSPLAHLRATAPSEHQNTVEVQEMDDTARKGVEADEAVARSATHDLDGRSDAALISGSAPTSSGAESRRCRQRDILFLLKMAPKTIFITGANRGIGLGLVRHLLKVSGVETLIAGARNIDGAAELQALAKEDPRLHLLAVDVSDDESLQNSVRTVGQIVGTRGLNLLINNAGVIEPYGTASAPNRATVLRTIDVNAVSALLATQYFLPLLQKAAAHVDGDLLSPDRAAVINIGSDCSSQALNLRGSGPGNSLLAYKMSKVAMLSFARSMVADFKTLNIPVLVTTIHPGWVQTDMGGANAEITTDESVGHIVESIGKLNASHHGGLFNRQLEQMPF
ncbi:unnamed protein product [Caenorhabditis sp. 36 PRJEB53466]|nr:unnamed protein product [Caenorhabditis sp. 36 PRJEB53466]